MWVKVTLWSRPAGANQVRSPPADIFKSECSAQGDVFSDANSSPHVLSLWRAVCVKRVDPGNQASFSSVWRLLLETLACEPWLFILSSLFYVETFKLQECWYESHNRPGIPQEQSRLPRRRRSYAATVCFPGEEATKRRKVAFISTKRCRQTRSLATLAERCWGTLVGQTPALTCSI